MSKIIEFNNPNGTKDSTSVQTDYLKSFINCNKCGGYRFTDVYLLKKITPIEDPNLQSDAVAPVMLYECVKCGSIVDPFNPTKK